MIRKIIAIVIGLIASFIVIELIESIGYTIYPIPEGIDIRNIEALKTYISNAPTNVFLIIILGYAIGSFVGGFVSAWITKEEKIKTATTLGGILMGIGAINLFTIPHPIWVIVVALLVFIPFSYFGGKLGIKISEKKS